MAIPKETFSIDETIVSVYPNVPAAGEAAGDRGVFLLKQTLEQQEKARIIVATGDSQLSVVHRLATAEGVDWLRVQVFHMDEYVGLLDTHPASFRRWIRERLTDIVHPADTYYLDGDARDPEEECRRYASALSAEPIDIVFGGFGENGHIAFNDPHVVDFEDPQTVKRVSLAEASREQQVREGHFAAVEETPSEALTITIPVILDARHRVFCAPEERKAEAVKRALEGPVGPECPGTSLRMRPDTWTFLDETSAGLLEPATRRG